MWHWLHKSVWARNLSRTARISIMSSCILHGILLLLFLILHLMRPVTRIQVHKDLDLSKTVTIVIDPTASKNGVLSHTAAQQLSTVPSKNNNVASPGTTVVTQKNAPAKKNKPAPKPKKQAAKKSVTKKTATPKKVAQKPKPEPKKTEQKKSEKPVTLPEIKKPEAEKIVQPSPQAASAATQQEAVLPEGPILIARSASEAAHLTVAVAIQEELLRVWHPPIGTEDGISCTIQVTLDAQGKLTEFAIKKSSGFLLFDVSARAAIQQAVWPQAVWGTILELCLQ